MADVAGPPLAEERNVQPTEGALVEIRCSDGLVLGGHLWAAGGSETFGSVVINPATGVLARYYHYYARFLAAHGFDVLTYDYRGIGLSRPARLRGCGYRWREWGEQDFDAALRFMRQTGRPAALRRRPQHRRFSAGAFQARRPDRPHADDGRAICLLAGLCDCAPDGDCC